MPDASPTRAERPAWLLWIGALALGSVVAFAIRQMQLRQPEIVVPPKGTQNPPPTLAYTPVEGRSAEMQAFDKALLFIAAQQEPDGHWSAARSGAAPEFSNANGDVASTALAAYAMLCAIQVKTPIPDGLGRARRALDWLQKRVRVDGGIADEAASGDPVVAQLLSCMTFIQAGSMSTRENIRSIAGSATRYAFKNMPAEGGGFSTSARAKHARADATALAVFVYQAARMDKILSVGQPESADAEVTAFETEIEKKLKAGVQALIVAPEKKDGVFSADSGEKKPDWDATVASLLMQINLNLPPKVVTPGFNFVLGEPDKLGTYPGPESNMAWGSSGEGYRALTLWFGTFAFALYGDTSEETKAWEKKIRPLIFEHQAADGSWPVAGHDGERGKVWRTALTALSLILVNPPQPTLPTPDSTRPTAPN
jgi:hypothetical protein